MLIKHEHCDEALAACYCLVPWDTEAFGFSVGQITQISIRRSEGAHQSLSNLLKVMSGDWGCKLVTCRLPHDQLRESMLLESCDFRFVEMVMHSRLRDLSEYESDSEFSVLLSTADDLSEIERIARTAFSTDRIRLDPRLSPELASERYCRWVRNSPSQSLLKIVDSKGALIAFFLVEQLSSHEIHWALTAIAPEKQGKGFGKRIWSAVLAYHKSQDVRQVTTTIAARNLPVLNLYSALGARIEDVEMTFHLWYGK